MGSNGDLIGVGSVEIGVLIGVYGDRVLIAWVCSDGVLIEWIFPVGVWRDGGSDWWFVGVWRQWCGSGFLPWVAVVFFFGGLDGQRGWC